MAVGGWDVFVSYGHGDAAWVRVLAGNLHRVSAYDTSARNTPTP